MRKLNFFTISYISIPTFLFLILWLNAFYSIVSVLSLIIVLVLSNKYLEKKDIIDNENGKLKGILASSFLFALILCLFSEFGIIGYESYDYTAHNLKFNMLATQDLPLYDKDRDIYMCYYLGNYLVPSFLGKYTSVGMVKIYFFLWSYIGIGLAFTWLQIRLINLSHLKRILLCFALLIGAYVCVILPLIHIVFPQLSYIKSSLIEINEQFILTQIPIFTRSLSESPQHSVPAILGICYFLATFTRGSYFFSLAYFLLASLFLAPFTAIGLVGFLVFACVKNLFNLGKYFLVRSIIFLIFLLLAYGPVMLFLTSSEATDMESNRAIWSSGTPYWSLYYLFYILSSYGIWFLFFGKKLIEFDRTAIVISSIILIIMSMFQMGHYNDLNMRAGVIPQMVLAIGVTYVIIRNWSYLFKEYLFTIGVFFWFLNSLSPLKFYYDRLFVLEGTESTIEDPGLEKFGKSYYDFMEKAYPLNPEEAVKQYSLKKGSIFEMYLLKKR